MNLVTYPNREAWLKARKAGLGGSDAAAVLGHSPYKSRYTLWAEKAGVLEPEDISELWHIRRGHYLETAVLAMWSDESGNGVYEWTPNTIMWDEEYPFLFATPDALVPSSVIDTSTGCEIKTSSATRPSDWEDGPPIEVQIQCQKNMRCHGTAEVWHYCALLNLREPPLIGTIERNDRFIEAMVAEEVRFWEEHVLPQRPPEPDDSEGTERSIKRVFPRVEGEGVTLSEDLLDAQEGWLEAGRQLKELRAAVRRIEKLQRGHANRLRAAIGSAAYGIIPGAGGALTLKETHIAERVQAAYSYRTLRFRKDAQ